MKRKLLDTRKEEGHCKNCGRNLKELAVTENLGYHDFCNDGCMDEYYREYPEEKEVGWQ